MKQKQPENASQLKDRISIVDLSLNLNSPAEKDEHSESGSVGETINAQMVKSNTKQLNLDSFQL